MKERTDRYYKSNSVDLRSQSLLKQVILAGVLSLGVATPGISGKKECDKQIACNRLFVKQVLSMSNDYILVNTEKTIKEISFSSEGEIKDISVEILKILKIIQDLKIQGGLEFDNDVLIKISGLMKGLNLENPNINDLKRVLKLLKNLYEKTQS